MFLVISNQTSGSVEIDPDNQVPNPTKMEKVHLSYGAVIFTDEDNVLLAPLSKIPLPERSVQEHSFVLKACPMIFLLRFLIEAWLSNYNLQIQEANYSSDKLH